MYDLSIFMYLDNIFRNIQRSSKIHFTANKLKK